MLFKLKRDEETTREFELCALSIDDCADIQDFLKYNEDGSISNWNKTLIRIARKKIIGLIGFESKEFNDEILVKTYGNLLNAMSALAEIGSHLMSQSRISEDETKN